MVKTFRKIKTLTTTVAVEASIDQDQAAQNVQPDPRSTLSTYLYCNFTELCRLRKGQGLHVFGGLSVFGRLSSNG